MKAAPAGFSQLFIISVLLSGVVWRPLMYLFMVNKYQDSYEEMFAAIASNMKKH